jgi:PhnB protein
MATKPIPEGWHTLSAHLAVGDAARGIEYCVNAFGAKERRRLGAPHGMIGHAEVEIRDSVITPSDPFRQVPTRPPRELGHEREPVSCMSRTSWSSWAVEAGASVTLPVADQFWGDRFGTITDPFGHMWSIATHVQDIGPEQIGERGRAAMAAVSSN